MTICDSGGILFHLHMKTCTRSKRSDETSTDCVNNFLHVTNFWCLVLNKCAAVPVPGLQVLSAEYKKPILILFMSCSLLCSCYFSLLCFFLFLLIFGLTRCLISNLEHFSGCEFLMFRRHIKQHEASEW